MTVKQARAKKAEHEMIKIGYDTVRSDYETLKTNLMEVEAEITSLRQETSEHEEILTRIKELEKEIQRLIALDPANLLVKANEIRTRVQDFCIENIEEEKERISEKLQETDRTRKRLEAKLNTVKSEEEEEAQRLKSQIGTLERSECLLRLEKIILDRQEAGLNIKLYKPRLKEIEADLEKLEKERIRLRAQIDCLEMMKIIEKATT